MQHTDRFIYEGLLRKKLSAYTFMLVETIYIYMCVCVCVCRGGERKRELILSETNTAEGTDVRHLCLSYVVQIVASATN